MADLEKPTSTDEVQNTRLDLVTKLRKLLRIKNSKVTEGDAHPKAAEAGSLLSNWRIVTFNQQAVIFGMDWVPAKSNQVREVIAKARKSGMRSTASFGNLTGFTKCQSRIKGQGDVISAALVLADSASIGGSELYAFELSSNIYALIALQDSSPVPGFDIIGDLETIQASAERYLRLPHKAAVRRCGSRDILDDAELINFEAILESIDVTEARLKKIADHTKTLKMVLLGALVFGGAYGGYVYFDYLQQLEEQKRIARENDPDMLYERAFEVSSANVKTLGPEGLTDMLNTSKRIPMDVGGWVLSNVKCTPLECTAEWDRRHGSYADFESNVPDGVSPKPIFSFLGSTGSIAKVKTVHPVQRDKPGVSLKQVRSSLPMQTDVQLDFVSQMQDYNLIKIDGSVEKPNLFGSTSGDLLQIFRPVLSGRWAAKGELWQLEDFNVPSYAIVDTLEISNMDQLGKQTFPIYAMVGRYFVKGREFK